jgi:N-acyl-D-aspartate/D-glutamate deacylase
MPAKRLEGIASMMNNKGRICAGADADITIFDPEQIIDQATYEEPAKYSMGIKYVLVNGIIMVEDGQLHDGIFPGKVIRGDIR